jgi:hypothetical protein
LFDGGHVCVSLADVRDIGTHRGIVNNKMRTPTIYFGDTRAA